MRNKPGRTDRRVGAQFVANKNGSAVLASVAIAGGVAITLAFLIPQIFPQILRREIATRNHESSRTQLRSVGEYLKYALKNRWCLTNELLQNTDCKLKDPRNLERLLFTQTSEAEIRDRIKTLVDLQKNAPSASIKSGAQKQLEKMGLSENQIKGLESIGLSPADATSAPSISGELIIDRVLETTPNNHPVRILLTGLQDRSLRRLKYSVERENQKSKLPYGEEVIINIKVTGISDNSGNAFGSAEETLELAYFIAPRELTMFSLISSESLDLSGKLPGPSAQFKFTPLSNSAPGVRFISPIYVQGDLILPDSDIANHPPKHDLKVKFDDTILLGRGQIKVFDTKLNRTIDFAPTSSDLPWSQYPTFSGITKGVELDSKTDPGLDNLFKVAILQGDQRSQLVKDCIDNSRRVNEPLFTRNSVLAAKISNSSAKAGELNNRITLALTGMNTFVAKEVKAPNSNPVFVKNIERSFEKSAVIALDFKFSHNYEQKSHAWTEPLNWGDSVKFVIPKDFSVLEKSLSVLSAQLLEKSDALKLAKRRTDELSDEIKNIEETREKTDHNELDSKMESLTAELKLSESAEKAAQLEIAQIKRAIDPIENQIAAEKKHGENVELELKLEKVTAPGNSHQRTHMAELVLVSRDLHWLPYQFSVVPRVFDLASTQDPNATGGQQTTLYPEIKDLRASNFYLDISQFSAELKHKDATTAPMGPNFLLNRVGDAANLLTSEAGFKVTYSQESKTASIKRINDENPLPTSEFGILDERLQSDSQIVSALTLLKDTKLDPFVLESKCRGSDNVIGYNGSRESADWDYDFSAQTGNSWDFHPYVGELRFPIGGNPATEKDFHVYSRVSTCTITEATNFVAGDLVCKELKIESRTNALVMIGTFIVEKLSIHDNAYKAGVIFSNIHNPWAISLLRAKGVLTKKVPGLLNYDRAEFAKIAALENSFQSWKIQNPGSSYGDFLTRTGNSQYIGKSSAAILSAARAKQNDCSDEPDPESPSWHPEPSFYEVTNRISCSSEALRLVEPMKSTTVDPDCGNVPNIAITTCRLKLRPKNIIPVLLSVNQRTKR